MFDNSLNCVTANADCDSCATGTNFDCGGGKALVPSLSWNSREQYYVLVHSGSGTVGGQFKIGLGGFYGF